VWEYVQQIWIPHVSASDTRYPRGLVRRRLRLVLIVVWALAIARLGSVSWALFQLVLLALIDHRDIRISDLVNSLSLPSFVTDARTSLWIKFTTVLLCAALAVACIWAIRDEAVERQVLRARHPHRSVDTLLRLFLVALLLVVSASAVIIVAFLAVAVLGSFGWAGVSVPAAGTATALIVAAATFAALGLALLVLVLWVLRELRLRIYRRYPRRSWMRTARRNFLVLAVPLLAYLILIAQKAAAAAHTMPQFWQHLTLDSVLSLAMVGGLAILRGVALAEILVVAAVLYVFLGCALAFGDQIVEWYVEIHKARWRIRDLRTGPRLLGDRYYDESRIFYGQDASYFHEPLPEDALAFTKMADRLTDLILRSADNTPLVISIEAAWGTGKTTLMRMIQRRIDRYRFTASDIRWRGATTFFTTWRYEAKDAQTAFMGTLFRAAPTGTLRWYVGPFMRGRLIRAIADLVNQLLQRGELANYVSNRLDIVPSYVLPLEEDFRKLLDYWIPQYGRKRTLLVMFIDDVDRCDDDALLKVFQMLKLYFDYPGVVFVIGFDPERVGSVVQEHFPHTDPNAYLEKILSYRYPLPSPLQVQLRNLIRQWLKEMHLPNLLAEISDLDSHTQDGLLDSLIAFTQRKLRRIKLTLNTIAEILALLPDPTGRDIHVVFILALIRHIKPDTYKLVARLLTEGQLDEALAEINAFAQGA
jgi:hypothetical protein